MKSGISELVVEQFALAWLESVGCHVLPEIAASEPVAERSHCDEAVILQHVGDEGF